MWSFWVERVKQLTANVVLPDNILAWSGPEAQEVRLLLRNGVKTLVEPIWGGPANTSAAAPFEAGSQSNLFFDELLELKSQDPE